MSERRFTDEEVREVLRRAVEDVPGTALASGDGLTLSELEAIGAEVGIDAERIERAVWSMDHAPGQSGGRLLGGPRLLSVRRKVPGEVPEGAAPEVLAAIRRHLGRAGDVSEVGGAIEWRATGEVGEQHVSVATRDGSTTITASANLSSAAVLAYLPPGMLAGIASLVGFVVSANDANELGMILSLAVVPAVLGLARTLFGRFTRSQAAALDAAVREVASLVEKGGEE